MKRITYNSPVILTFALLSFGALLLEYITGGYVTGLLFSVYRSAPTSPFFYLRLLGHIFGHSSFEHYFSNFVVILLIGPMLEEKYGSGKLAIMILFTAVITGLIHILLFSSAVLGASGVAFMLILLSSFVNFKKGEIPLTLILIIVFYLGKEIIGGLFVSDQISQFSHIIGGCLGGVFGFVLDKK